VRVAATFYGIVALFAFGFALFSSQAKVLLGEKPPEATHLLAGLGIGLALVGLSRLGTRVWPPVDRAARALGRLLGPVTWGDAILLALVSGVAEELLFRGALWPPLGLVGTTCLFALVHVIPRKDLWGYPLFAGACGLLFGLLRDGTDSVVPPMIAHVLVNAINIGWLGGLERKAAEAASPRPAA
jgi:membrane protease YdiL (CAAX protease family)